MGTRIRIKPNTFTVNANDIRKLCNIVVKACDADTLNNIRFRMSGGTEDIFTSNIDEFVGAKWPADVEEIHLSAQTYGSGKEIECWFRNETSGIREVTVAGNDVD